MTNKSLLFLTICLLLSACASQQPLKISDTMVRPHIPVEEEVTVVEETPSEDEFAGLDTQRTYSLALKDAELRDALLLVSRKTGQSITVDRDVFGKVSADFTDKSITEILNVMVKPHGYTISVEEGVIRVSKPQLITKMFSMNYLKDKRSSTSTMSASGSDNKGSSSNISTTGESDFWCEVITGLDVIIFGTDTTTEHAARMETLTKSYASGDIAKATDEIPQPPQSKCQSITNGYANGDKKTGKQLIVNDLAGTVYVRDYADNMENVKSFIHDIEKSVKRQVMIQAHIAEVSLNDSFSLGINWSNILTSGIGKTLRPMTFSQNLAISPTEAFQISVTNSKVNALLDAMKEQGQLNMLSSPKVSTLNNQKAVIKLTTREVSWYQKTTTTGSPPVIITDSIPQIDEVGIYLDVTPQISEKGSIAMQIHPNISETTSVSISPDGKSSRPIINIREVDTMIEVKNNQTIVIAGLIVDKIIETKRSVPLLGDIPFLGTLFRYVSHTKKKTELVILITPYILSDKTVSEIRKEHEQRLKDAGRPFSLTPLPAQ